MTKTTGQEPTSSDRLQVMGLSAAFIEILAFADDAAIARIRLAAADRMKKIPREEALLAEAIKRPGVATAIAVRDAYERPIDNRPRCNHYVVFPDENCVSCIATERDRLRAVNAELVAALEDVELRCTQARLASKIGKKRDSSEFLCGEVERIAVQARAALARAKE